MEGGALGQNLKSSPPNHHPSQFWYSSFRGQDLNVEVYDIRQTDRRMPSDGKNSHDL
jgi:hypothetical protein